MVNITYIILLLRNKSVGNTLIALYQLTSIPKELVGIITLFKNKFQLKRKLQQLDCDFGLLFKIVKRGPGVDEGVIDGIPGAERYFTTKGIAYVIGSDTDISFPDDSYEFNNYL
jgi:hypothetical protein